MNFLFLTALGIVTNAALHAQEIKPDAKLLQRAFAYKLRSADTLRKSSPHIEIVPSTRVQILPQDGMPCIVPDTTEIAVMPNALPAVAPLQPIAGQIPNAWNKKDSLKTIITGK